MQRSARHKVGKQPHVWRELQERELENERKGAEERGKGNAVYSLT